MGPGKILPGELFSKRYTHLWPGADVFIKKFLYRGDDANFNQLKNSTESVMLEKIPMYSEKIKEIFNSYNKYEYFPGYKILRNV